MESKKLVLKLKVKQFSRILYLAESVYDRLLGNALFPVTSPSLPELMAGIIKLREAIANLGPKGNRGSHEDHVMLELSALELFNLLQSLAAYCEGSALVNFPEGMRDAALSTTGFALKKPRSPQGVLEMVQNFHHFIARNVRQSDAKMRWVMPLNVNTHTNVKSYIVWRSAVNNFSAAKSIAVVTACTYTDTPGSGKWFYWIAPFNCMGVGVVSHSIAIDVI